MAKENVITLDEIVKILGTRLNIDYNDNSMTSKKEVEICINKFSIVELDTTNNYNIHIALYAIKPTEQEAKEALVRKIQGKLLVRKRRFGNDICPIYPMPTNITV